MEAIGTNVPKFTTILAPYTLEEKKPRPCIPVH